MGTPQFDYYYRTNSKVHQLDPRVKVIWVACATTLSMTFNDPLYQFILFASVILVGVAGKLKVVKILQICRPILYMGLGVAFLWTLVEKSGNPLITIGSFFITDTGLLYGLSVGMRITTLLIAIIVLLMTTDQGELMGGFVALGVPYPFVLAVILSLRFFPTLLGEFKTLQEAQSSRGLEWEKGGLVTRVKNTMPLFVPLVIRGLQIVQNLSYSVESRGFGATKTRTCYRELSVSALEKRIILVIVLGTALIVFLRIFFDFGVYLPESF
jgi:energy-coupling factor transport system permease protein